MKKHYFLPLLQGAYFMLVSLFLQNCSGLMTSPIQGEQEPIEAIEQQEQVSIKVEGQEEQGNTLSSIMPELWQEIFSYLDFEAVLAARAVNSEWNKLITGYKQAGIVGVENNPHHIIDTRGWIKEKEIDFRNNKLKGLTPARIPSFAFYHLMVRVKNFTQSFWPYLAGTQVHTLNLKDKLIGAEGAIELAKALPGTKVHTLDLSGNGIGAEGALELAKALSGTQVHTLALSNNGIGDTGVLKLAKVLPATYVHTLNLAYNQIGDVGACELAKVLPATCVYTLYLLGNEIGAQGTCGLAKALASSQVHTLNLGRNQIRDAGTIELAKALPSTRVHTLYLGSNRIGDAGAIELAKALPATRVHTLSLSWNQIEGATKQLLKEQYPHIRWEF